MGNPLTKEDTRNICKDCSDEKCTARDLMVIAAEIMYVKFRTSFPVNSYDHEYTDIIENQVKKALVFGFMECHKTYVRDKCKIVVDKEGNA